MTAMKSKQKRSLCHGQERSRFHGFKGGVTSYITLISRHCFSIRTGAEPAQSGQLTHRARIPSQRMATLACRPSAKNMSVLVERNQNCFFLKATTVAKFLVAPQFSSLNVAMYCPSADANRNLSSSLHWTSEPYIVT